jgi:rRNA maturation endonuclease Nob1
MFGLGLPELAIIFGLAVLLISLPGVRRCRHCGRIVPDLTVSCPRCGRAK